MRANEIVQEYDRHLGAVNTVTFVDNNRRFVSTSDDKSIRVWEWSIPVEIKYISEPHMHSMPAVTPHPNGTRMHAPTRVPTHSPTHTYSLWRLDALPHTRIQASGLRASRSTTRS